jgi:NAD(P) transhydrogenase subunit beta
MSHGLLTMSYIAASILFILSLSGLSQQETSRRGNYFGMAGMFIAILATVLGSSVHGNLAYEILLVALLVGGFIGSRLAAKVAMTQMPELVASMHSLVGLAAVLVGYTNFLEEGSPLVGIEKSIHEVEIYIGVFIGAVTFSGSVIAFGKLCGRISGKPLTLPGRHVFNLILFIITCYLGYRFVGDAEPGNALLALAIMTGIALVFGVHMVMAIGGADMPALCLATIC